MVEDAQDVKGSPEEYVEGEYSEVAPEDESEYDLDISNPSADDLNPNVEEDEEEPEEDGMELTYKGKPQGNVYRDNKTTGESEIVGYMYRGKIEIHDRNMPKAVMAFFDVWVNIKLIEKFEFENIDA